MKSVEYALDIRRNGKFVRQIDIYQDFNEAKNKANEMKTEIGEFCTITEIIYDDDENEIGSSVIYEIRGWL